MVSISNNLTLDWKKGLEERINSIKKIFRKEGVKSKDLSLNLDLDALNYDALVPKGERLTLFVIPNKDSTKPPEMYTDGERAKEHLEQGGRFYKIEIYRLE